MRAYPKKKKIFYLKLVNNSMIKYLLFFLNSLVAGGLIVLWGLSFIPPTSVPVIPSVTLLTPVLLLFNVLFCIYWILKLNKRCLLSLIALLICSSFFSSFIQFNFNIEEDHLTNGQRIKILDYNSHYFLSNDSGKSFKKDFITLINKEQPDIVFFQEDNLYNFKVDFSAYPYKKATVTNGRAQGANPIISKYPIINHGSVGMDNVHIGRNALYADLKIGKDTLRCYNMHLTSYRLAKKVEELQEKGAKTIVSRLNKVFKYQEQQVEKIVANVESCPYPVVVCGDFNNMAFSYVYRELKNAGGLKDTFVEKGNGFGATIDFSYFPTRIDFILVPNKVEVLKHKVIKTKDWSDHYPVITEIKL